jgi:hypothetical protein
MAEFTPKLGWLSPDERTPEQNECHERIVASMPDFRLIGSRPAMSDKKVVLTDVWKHPAVVEAIGYPFPRIHQLTGSCVGAGGGNGLFTLSAIEVVRLGDREQIVVPGWLFTYGKSRQRGGLRGRGEGSFGSAWAEAIKLDGIVPANYPGMPGFRNEDGLVWSSNDEYKWSDGAAIPDDFAREARKYLVKTVSPLRDADDVRESIVNGYPCTAACGGFVGKGYVRGSGSDAVLIGSIDSRGGHQTSIQGWMEHPQFGELFLYVNQWPEQVYPKDPAGGPPCSVWINKQTMNQICREEVYGLSQFDGFPAQEIEKSLFRIMG